MCETHPSLVGNKFWFTVGVIIRLSRLVRLLHYSFIVRFAMCEAHLFLVETLYTDRLLSWMCCKNPHNVNINLIPHSLVCMKHVKHIYAWGDSIFVRGALHNIGLLAFTGLSIEREAWMHIDWSKYLVLFFFVTENAQDINQLGLLTPMWQLWNSDCLVLIFPSYFH